MTIAKTLLALQDTDQALALRRREYRKVEEELKSEGGLPELRDNCEKIRVKELEAKVETARLESDLAMLKDQVGELETRLYGGAITNVRELTAIETEHSAARRNLAQIEESIAPAEVAAEHARQRYEELTEELASKEKVWKTRRLELGQEKTKVGTEFNRSGDGFDSSSSKLHPRAEIELYCQRNKHQLVAWFEPAEDEPANDFDARHDRYRQMIASFTGANARLALVLVPDASHIAEDLETLVTRLLELERLDTEIRCTDPDRPDALQSGEELLGLGGRSPQRQARIRDAIVAKASRGEVLGRTPFGYEAGVDGLLKPVAGDLRNSKKPNVSRYVYPLRRAYCG